MMRFIKNNIHGLVYFWSPSGRDSRQTFCDIYKGFILLALFGIFACAWRNTLAMLYLRDIFVISEQACWILCIIYELFLLLAFATATLRRWQDLDIRIPKDDSFGELIKRARFWEVLMSEEGSDEPNEHGPAPADNPAPLISEADFKEEVRKKLFVDLDHDIEEIK